MDTDYRLNHDRSGASPPMSAKRVSAALPALSVLSLLATAMPAGAEDDYPTFVIHMSNGVISPAVVEVPANTRFKLELQNDGSSPVEFESLPLRKEKVLAPGAKSFIVIRNLAPGNYAFFDDFHLDMPPARLIAR
nr:cupredoxin domain-containing protein [Rhizobium sullae]